MDPGSLAALAAGSVLGGMYLNARLLLKYDWHMIKTSMYMQNLMNDRLNRKRYHYYYNFRDQAKATPNRVFLIFEEKSYTYLQLEKASSRLARWLLDQGVKYNDVVCIMEQNHPTLFIALLAISKISAVPALINTNLTADALFHCISVVKPRVFLFDPVYTEAVSTVIDRAKGINVGVFAYGEATEEQESTCPIAPSLTPSVLGSYSDEDTSESYLKMITINDTGMLIYTSGTTGLPKAAVAQHFKLTNAINSGAVMTQMKPSDRVYCVLPLYHSSGLWLAFGHCLVAGAKFVLARKFSASRFWDQCVKYEITRFYYIGELCRYLLNQPPHPLERKHKVNVIYGNGLRPEIFAKFKERFGIHRVWEFYGATEGTIGLYNYNTGPIGEGAVGRVGPLARLYRKDFYIVKIDPATEEILRDKNGFCIQCKPGEYGELLTIIRQDTPVRYPGYYDNETATEKKKIRNVQAKGDLFFRTGDLLKMTSDGMLYFGDRLGDTFRWHAENVATTEVTKVATEYPGIAEANVYGVKVPNHDGRAGMIALVCRPGEKLDLTDFYRHLAERLPRYAVPVFIRFLSEIDVTGTFKQQKVVYRDQGIDFTKLPPNEPIFWARNNTFVPFTKEDYTLISTGNVKL